jgi:hypothetical protein
MARDRTPQPNQPDGSGDMIPLDARVRYRVVAGLLYPAALGAAVVWWVNAATWRPMVGETAPLLWAMWFSGWFVIYHGVWYIHLVGEHEGPSENAVYPIRRFVADLVDVSAIICAFAALGFASGQYHLFLPGVYGAAGLIPLAAVIGRSHRRLGNTALMAIAGLASLVGVGTHLAAGADGITSLDVTLLREYWLVLVAYLVVPSVFGAKVGRTSRGFTGEIYGVE